MTATSIQSKNLTMKPISDNNLEMSSMTLKSQAKCEVMTSASMIDRIEKVLTCSIPRTSVSVFEMTKLVTCKIGMWWSYQSLDEKEEFKVFRINKSPNKY